jgi:hypothetical protein
MALLEDPGVQVEGVTGRGAPLSELSDLGRPGRVTIKIRRDMESHLITYMA